MVPRLDDDLQVERFADALLARLQSAASDRQATAPHRRGRLRVVIAAAAVGAAVAAGVLIVRGLSPADTRAPVGAPGPPATAEMVLLRSATSAAHQRPLAPGQYLRVRMLRWSRGADGLLHRVVFTSWMATDGSARFLVAPGAGSGFERSDERCTPRGCVLRTAGAPPQAMPAGHYGPGLGFTAAQLQRLPTNPQRLLAVIRARAATGVGLSRDPWELGFPLLAAPVPPQVRAALFRALASLPGVQRLGVEQVGDRSGVALVRRLRMSGATAERVIVVDPTSGSLLAARALVKGRISDRRVYSAAIVSSQ